MREVARQQPATPPSEMRRMASPLLLLLLGLLGPAAPQGPVVRESGLQHYCPGPPGAFHRVGLAFPTVNRVSVVLLCGYAGRLTAKTGGLRPGPGRHTAERTGVVERVRLRGRAQPPRRRRHVRNVTRPCTNSMETP